MWAAMKSCFKAAVLLAAVCCLLSAGPETAQAQDTTSVRLALVQAASGVDEVVARSGREGNYVMFAAAASLKSAIESFRNATRDQLDVPPRGLSAPQRQRFEDIQRSVEALQRAATEPLPQARASLREVRRLTDDAPPAAGDVQLAGASPSVLTPPSRDEIQYTIRGAGLDRSEPRLFFSGLEAARRSVSARQAVFGIPSSALPFSETAASVYAGRLVLTDRQCTLKVFCKNTPREYTVLLLMMPARLASVQVTFNRAVKQRIYDSGAALGAPAGPAVDKLYTRTFDYSNDDLTLLSCSTPSQAPHAPGYFIDTDSLSLTVKSSTGESRSRIASASSTGFTLELCAQARISQLIKTSGAISVQASWKEYEVADVVLPSEALAPQPLRWGTPLEVSLPPDTHASTVEVYYFDGSHVTYSGDASDERVEVRWDEARHQVRLTARDPSSLEGTD